MTSNITPENYIFRFGKYINQRADQVAKIYKVDKKSGLDIPEGLNYMKFLCDKCDWFRHKDVIQIIINKYDNELNVDDNEPKKEIKKENKCKSVTIETNKVLNMS